MRHCFNPPDRRQEFVTADHIGEGRFGLNLVVGWNEDEFEMFRRQAADHEGATNTLRNGSMRKLAWGPQEDFDFDGAYISSPTSAPSRSLTAARGR